MKDIVFYSIEDRSRVIPAFVAVTISPNPAKDRADIRFPATTSGQWQVRDITGKVLNSGNYSEIKEVTMDLKPYQPGLYYLTLHMTDGSRQTQKIVVQQ